MIASSLAGWQLDRIRQGCLVYGLLRDQDCLRRLVRLREVQPPHDNIHAEYAREYEQ